MDGLWEATLDPNSPRYNDWKQILESEKVPIKSPAAFECKLGENETDQVYALDIPKLDDGQFRRLVEFIQKKFGVTETEVEAELFRRGFPIRDSDVIVAFSMRAFL